MPFCFSTGWFSTCIKLVDTYIGIAVICNCRELLSKEFWYILPYFPLQCNSWIHLSPEFWLDQFIHDMRYNSKLIMVLNFLYKWLFNIVISPFVFDHAWLITRVISLDDEYHNKLTLWKLMLQFSTSQTYIKFWL